MQKILVVEDDPTVARGLIKSLEEEGYEAHHATTAKEARNLFPSISPDLILLDLGLPDEDGMLLMKDLRKQNPEVLVLILSARNEVDDRVSGLDRGAIDYIGKPFALPELLARLRMHLRRSGSLDAAVLKAGKLRIDLLGRSANQSSELLDLPPREFDLLVTLVRSVGKPVSREQIAREVWQAPRRMSSLDNLIDVHISRLRERLDPDISGLSLRTIRGVGYQLDKEVLK